MEKIDRRGFLKGAVAAGALAATSGALLTGCQPSSTGSTGSATDYPVGLCAEDFTDSPVELSTISKFADEKTYDVVVVGAGTGGVPAALTALEEGATVAVLQKANIPISQGGLSSGVVLDKSTDMGVMNYIEGYLQDCGWRADRGLTDFYCAHGGETIRWMEVRTKEAGFPPYKVSESTKSYDDGSYCVIRSNSFGPKPNDNGTAITALAELAAKKGVEFYYSTPGVQLIQDGTGTVTGVVGKDEGGNYIKFNAEKGVIVSTGDYQNNTSLVERYCPDVKDFDRKQFGKTGDGILMCMAVGAGFVPVAHPHMMHDFDSGPMYDEPFLMVNEDGERFMNEKKTFTEVNNVLRSQPEPGWYSQIFDSNYAAQVTAWGGRAASPTALQVYMPDVKMDRSAESKNNVIEHLIDTYSCDTLDELAGKLGIPADALKKSVNRYNELCTAGFDEDFGKQTKYLKKIDTPPYYGIHKHVRISALCAGVTVDEDYRVVTKEGTAIPGLWATGFGAGQLCGTPDWSMYQSGMSSGHCMITGRYCAIQAVTGKTEPTTPVTDSDVAAAGYDLASIAGVVSSASGR